MTYDEWRRDTTLAPKLKEALSLPIIQQALSVVNELTAAKTLGTTTAITTLSASAEVLFGFDAGRASVIKDLNDLTVVVEEIAEIQPSYMGAEF
jgi:hypothetical protein